VTMLFIPETGKNALLFTIGKAERRRGCIWVMNYERGNMLIILAIIVLLCGLGREPYRKGKR
jgi:hypothetical protein